MSSDFFSVLLSSGDGVFRDSRALDFDYVPECFDYRDGELSHMGRCVLPLLRGGSPEHCIIRGIPAVGKSTAVRKLFDEIVDTSSDIFCSRIDCHVHNTHSSILNVLHEDVIGHPPKLGGSKNDMYQNIVSTLKKKNDSLIVALDDADKLFSDTNDANKLFYDLLRANELYHVKICLFAIVSKVNFKFKLKPEVSTVFIPHEIIFEPYTFDQMYSILDKRAEIAFYPDCLEDDALSLVVESCMATNDLRYGIKILSSAANLAISKNCDKICKNHIIETINTLKYSP